MHIKFIKTGIFISLVTLVVVSITPVKTLAGPVIEWKVVSGGNGHFYQLVETQVAWTTAFAEATAATHMGMPGHLVTIENSEENNFVTANIAVDELAWIGFTDQVTEGTFEWVTGEPAGYTNWNTGEPNDGGSGEDYTELIGFTGSSTGKWNDISNNSGGGRFYVIEFEALTIPVFSRLALLICLAVLFGLTVMFNGNRIYHYSSLF